MLKVGDKVRRVEERRQLFEGTITKIQNGKAIVTAQEVNKKYEEQKKVEIEKLRQD